VLNFDLTGYGWYSVDTCANSAADSSVAVYDADPTLGGSEIACNEDALYEPMSFCSQTDDPLGYGLPARILRAPASGQIGVQIDEWGPGSYWDRNTTRVIEIELRATPPMCGNGFIEDGEGCDDGNGNSGDGCDASCSPEPMVITDCDPAYCTMQLAGGPNGGDLCTCTIDPLDHPRGDFIDGSCRGAPGGLSTEVYFDFDTTYYASFAASTCLTGADSVLSVYDGDPLMGGVEG
jgi:cysteine-rich repeat protein